MELQPMNVGPGERTLRMTVGWTVLTVGMVLVDAQGSAMRMLTAATLAVVGAAVSVTGHLGRCPVYRRLGQRSRSATRPHAGGAARPS